MTHSAKFSVTMAEMRRATQLLVRHIYRGKWAFVRAIEGALLGVFVVALIAVLLAIYGAATSGGAAARYTPLVVALGVIVLYGLFHGMRLKRWFVAGLSLPLGSDTEVTLSDDGFSHIRGGLSSHMPWRAVSCVLKGKGLICVVCGADMFVLPERAFEDPKAVLHDLSRWGRGA